MALSTPAGSSACRYPNAGLLKKPLQFGQSSGRDYDKFLRFGLKTFAAQRIAAPMLEECVAWMECRVIPDATQRYDLFIAEVIASYVDSKLFHDNQWDFGTDSLDRTMHYISNGEFFATGERFAVPTLE